MKKLVFALIAVLLLGGGAYAYFKMAAPEEEQSAATATVRTDTLVEKALAVGQIAPRHEIAVKSKVSGTVARIYIEEGDYVEAGAPLIEVRPSPTPLEYAQAKRTLEMRQLNETQRGADLQRTQGLHAHGMASQAELDRSRELRERATLERQMAEEELAILDRGRAVVAGRTVENVIASPVSGHVLDLSVDVGDPVVPLTSYQPGTELMRLADMRELLFEGSVDEIDVGKIAADMPVEIEVGAYPGQRINGRLKRIALKSELRDNATVFAVEIDQLAAPEELVLRAGYSANADIIIRRAEGVPVLPERVLHFRGDSTFVQLPGPSADADAIERYVQIGISDGIDVEIISGLEVGDTVLEKAAREIE